MPLPFKLQKLQIKTFPTAERRGKSLTPFTVPFNPASFSLTHASSFSKWGGTNPFAPEPVFVYSKPEELKVDLIFDGTGVADLGAAQVLRNVPGLASLPGLGSGASVADTVQAFLDACYAVVAELHQPNYLKISWGEGPLQDFDCRLSEAKITYTAFARDGSPLRAIVAATFLSDLPVPKKNRLAGLRSADLSHTRTVRAGDTVPLLCQDVYGSPAQHAAVARANDLDSLRTVPPGRNLTFPPVEG